jgi:methyl-accepting chemotaxis protein
LHFVSASQGINQINQSMAEIDKVIQAYATDAEQSAYASQKLALLVEKMKGSVSELITLVGGTGNGNTAQFSLLRRQALRS